jgi:hypothetical protein
MMSPRLKPGGYTLALSDQAASASIIPLTALVKIVNLGQSPSTERSENEADAASPATLPSHFL